MINEDELNAATAKFLPNAPGWKPVLGQPGVFTLKCHLGHMTICENELMCDPFYRGYDLEEQVRRALFMMCQSTVLECVKALGGLNRDASLQHEHQL